MSRNPSTEGKRSRVRTLSSHISQPFFSIVIPVLNEQRVISHLLLDLLGQTFRDFEVILVDGQSNDASLSKIASFESKYASVGVPLFVFQSEKRHVSVQRNKGASHAHGEYLLFLDADNRLPHYFLEGLHYNLMKKAVGLFTCLAEPDDQSTSSQIYMQIQNAGLELGKNLNVITILGACIGCQRSVFENSAGFDETISFMEDREFAQAIVNTGVSFEIYPDPTYTYSLRRIKKDGIVRHVSRLIPTWTENLLLGKKITEPVAAYPMKGGSYFDEKEALPPRAREWIKRIVDVFNKLMGEERIELGNALSELQKKKKRTRSS
ncbi:MAG: hypothetical protein A2378_03320 [Candidatus Pacebacteria bacterium RIFOXYB1_FULL_44_10]|nr:MAG: hypothetical protein A2378_03320 [Candidatus Pacebacteria bacterium RIFOXYB1_FULL_44_10]